jgi:hypothetical protein
MHRSYTIGLKTTKRQGATPKKIVVSRAIGIDVGLTLLSGSEIANPRWVKQVQD